MVDILSDADLIKHALKTQNPRDLSASTEAGGVACALVTDKGSVFTGVCIDSHCSMGFCAEHNAIGTMVTAGENRILSIVAVKDNVVISPCGRCREFIWQMHSENKTTRILLKGDRVKLLKELLPDHWKENETHE